VRNIELFVIACGVIAVMALMIFFLIHVLGS
jgi:hypothetical protein